MRRVDAVWEKRNLGVDCVELTAEPSDDAETLRQALDGRTGYTVLRVPSDMPRLLLSAQELGLRVIELQFHLTHDLKNVPPWEGRGCVRRRATEDDARSVMERVARGDVFLTDRISLDPAFGPQQAGRRYAGWIGDLLRDGQRMTVLDAGRGPAGFFVTKLRDAAMEEVLVGVFPEAQGRGLGRCAVLAALCEALDAGAVRMETAVSSNNPRSLHTHLRAGYMPSGTDYVLIKHT